MSAEFTVMMMGPEAVGKTTLLATMYKELAKIESYARFTFYADNDTGINLDNAYQKLSRIIEQPVFTSIKPLLEGTRGIIYHRFGINFKDKKELDLLFCDIAGGLLNVSASDQDFRAFQQQTVNIFGRAFIRGVPGLQSLKVKIKGRQFNDADHIGAPVALN